MKTLIIIATFFISLAVAAQRQSMVTITVNGSRNKEIRVDGRSYGINSSMTPIQITNLSSGQHSLELVRASRFGSFLSRINSRSIYLRPGYDLDITVTSNGFFQISESRIRENNRGYHRRYGTAMSSSDFNALINDIRYMRRSDQVTAINNAFTNSSDHFTTMQARILISMTYSESDRLYLAKAAYPVIIDPENFPQINSLLNRQDSRDELNEFVINYDNNYNDRYDGRDNGNGYNQGMRDAEFNSLYDNVRNQFGFGAKMSALVDIFNRTDYYFTSSQAKQLIQLVSNEDNRLELAKSSYDNIVDPGNFSQLYDLFSSQSRRNELSDYVRTHSR